MISYALVEHQNVSAQVKLTMKEFPAKHYSYVHDVAPVPAKNGPVWFTSELTGELGKLDPTTGNVKYIPLGNNSMPHGVILAPDGTPWITDGGLNAMVRVDPKTDEVKVFPLPKNITNIYKKSLLNTPTIDKEGMVWFTGRAGFYGKLNPETGKYNIFLAPRGQGPYGITTSPDGVVFFNSWNGNYTGKVDPRTGNLTILEPPTKNQMVRRASKQRKRWAPSSGGSVQHRQQWTAHRHGYRSIRQLVSAGVLPGHGRRPSYRHRRRSGGRGRKGFSRLAAICRLGAADLGRRRFGYIL